MAVEAVVATVGASNNSNQIGPSQVGKLSDGTLVCVHTDAISNNFYIRKSTDGGVSWSSAYTDTTCGSGALLRSCLVQDDFVYLTFERLFRRLDYSGGVFSSGVACTTPFGTGAGGSVADVGCFAKEASGRLWSSRKFFDGADSLNKIQVVYSDNNGSTWSSITTLHSIAAATPISAPVLYALENNLVIAYCSNINAFTRDRLHTDTPTAWTAETSRLDVLSGPGSFTGVVTGAPLATIPVKKLFIIANDSASGGTGGLQAIKVVETGSSLTYSIFSVTSTTDSGTVVSGRTDGWRVVTIRTADLTKLRIHLVGESATAWPIYSEITPANVAYSKKTISTIQKLFNSKDTNSDFSIWATTTTNTISRTDVLPGTLNSTRVIPISWRFLPGFFRSLPVSWTGLFTASRNIPIAWLSGYVFFYRSIPAAWLGKLAIKRVIPLTWHGPIPFGMTRSVPIAWSALKVFQRQLPVNWSVVVVDDWLVITSPEGDSWAVLPVSPEADAWSPLSTPESDSWSA